MHLVNGFTRIQSLRDFDVISPCQLPVQPILDDAWVFGCLGEGCLALHAVIPLPFFLSLPFSPLHHNSYIKIPERDLIPH